MENIIRAIFSKELREEVLSISQMNGLGVVNDVYLVEGNQQEYILRINGDISPVEYQKECWCMSAVSALGIPSPTIIVAGEHEQYQYTIQHRVPGENGKACLPEDLPVIWESLGRYARQYHRLEKIEVAEVNDAEFHADWKARLRYNLAALNEKDQLLVGGHFNREEHAKARKLLRQLEPKTFRSGLVHGDLCPRNAVYDGQTVSLLDWGTAEVNVVPHVELGILQMNGECSVEAFQYFLDGYGLSAAEFRTMEEDLRLLKFLHQLDKFRWAESYAKDELPEFIAKVRTTFGTAMACV